MKFKINLLKQSILIFSLSFALSCKDKEKEATPITPVPEVPGDDEVITPGVDPVIAKTIGFFLDEWMPKNFQKPEYTETAITEATTTTVTVDAGNIITKVPTTVFGQNANTWMSPMIDQPLFMNHITKLNPRIIRFPAGSGSDVYFWNSKPGELPADVPLQLVDNAGNKKDPGFMYGRTTDNWRASLDDYYTMLQQSNNKGILTVNYGYARYGTSENPVAAAAHYAADWVRYDNGRTKLWEIGNEVYADWEWGYRIDVTANKDGQPEYLTGKLYAQHFKVFADSMKKAAAEIGSKIYIGAVTYEHTPESWQVNTTKTWNSTMLPELNNVADFYIVHNYFTPYNENSTASVIASSAMSEVPKVIDFVTQQLQANNVDIKPVAMTEWNMWAKDSKQQVSNVSGVFAVLVIGESMKNKYGLAARWDLLNGWDNGNDHGLFSDGNEPGVAKWTPRPSFHYMYFFDKMLGDRLVNTTVTTNTNIKAYGSTFASGEGAVTLVNTSGTPQKVEVKMKNMLVGDRFYWYTLEGSTDNGEFSRKVLINGQGPTGLAGGPDNYATIKARSAATANGIKITVPARGMVCIAVDKK
jgi:hypothetical protein